MNLAVHAHQLLQERGQGIIASGVGSDELGHRLLAEVTQRGMSTQCISVSREFPTGTVEVAVGKEGTPTYEIRENVAWDHLTFTESWQQLAVACNAVCFGTLAQRSPESHKAIKQFLANAQQALHVFDINIRQHFYTADVIHESLLVADVLKLNEEELGTVSKLLEIGGPLVEFERGVQHPLAIDVLFKRYKLETIAVTRGEAGTVLFTPEGRFEATVPRFPRQANADSVGAGDACCGAIIVGLLLQKAPQEIVDLANRVGAFVASQAGATPKLPQEILDCM